jgi:hypothetical protein
VQIKQIALVRQPRERVWRLLRDALPQLAPQLDDIDAVETERRTEDAPGVWTIVNVWRARSNLAGLLPAAMSNQTLSWTDEARWYEDRFETCWEVRPHILAERIRCTGTTRYLEAMGGQGTRAVLEATAELLPDPLTGASVDLNSLLAKGIPAVAVTLVGKNFQRLLEITDKRLRQNER